MAHREDAEADGVGSRPALLQQLVKEGTPGSQPSEPTRQASEPPPRGRTDGFWILWVLKGSVLFKKDVFFFFTLRSTVNLHNTFYKGPKTCVTVTFEFMIMIKKQWFLLIVI